MKALLGFLLGAVCLTTVACVVQRGAVVSIDPITPDTTTVQSPVKAFLQDGSIVAFPGGVVVSEVSVRGPGMRYSLGLTDSASVSEILLDSIVGIEAFQSEVNVAGTVLGSAAASGAAAFGTAVLLVAIFGSCPTIYVNTDAGTELQAEAFSYSIAPLLEARDLDRLELKPAPDGTLRLELRNEALETHYINHLELVAVPHDGDVHVLPDHRGQPIGVGRTMPPVSAWDREGRWVLDELMAVDGVSFSSTEARIRAASSSDWTDHVELAFPVIPGADTAVVTLELRNSLLNTVLFYDLMLGAAGAGALDWIGRGMERIDTAVELGRWFHETMGLTVEVFDGSRWEHIARVGDSGPIAWKQVGVPVPVLQTDSLRVRLSFLADEWRIDGVSVGAPRPVGAMARLPVMEVTDLDGVSMGQHVASLSLPDEDYLVTHPGTAASLEFSDLPQDVDGDITYFLSTQGYYTEWVRPQWIRDGTDLGLFQPGEGTIEELMSRWLQQRDHYERAFFDSRIPVR